MKSNGLTTLLNGALAVALLAAVILCVQFFFLSRDARNMNTSMAGINAWRAQVQTFVSDCVKYSEKNPAIVPLLETIGGPKPGAAAKPGK